MEFVRKVIVMLFKKDKVFAYENSNGDKGIIIAKSMEQAEKLFHKEYPKRKIADNDEGYWDNGAYLFEAGEVKSGKLYCTFPW